MSTSFFELHPLFKDYNEKVIVSQKDRLPTDLITFLEGLNISSYRNGFFTFVNNDAFTHLLGYWDIAPEDSYIFMKTAFGMLLLYRDNEYQLLDPINNEIVAICGEEDLDFLINVILCDKVALDNTFLFKYFEQAIERIDPPELDECFAFIPAIRLGGGLNSQNIKLEKLNEQLLILSQI